MTKIICTTTSNDIQNADSIRKVPENVFSIANFDIRIKLVRTPKDTRYGKIYIPTYLLYTPYNGGWRVCEADWDRQHFKLPCIKFYFLNTDGNIFPFANENVSDRARKLIAGFIASYDRQILLNREIGMNHETIEDLMNGKYNTLVTPEEDDETNEFNETGIEAIG